MSDRAKATLWICAAALVGVVALRLLVDTGELNWPRADVAQLRLLRVAIGTVVGAALAVSGVMLQSLLRNPLASPDLLGLASGAGLAVVLTSYIATFTDGAVIPGGREAAALIGSLAALGVVYILAQRSGLLDPVSLILVGVIVAVIASAITSFVAYLLPDRGFAAMRWMFGSLDEDAPWPRIGVVGALTIVGTAMAWRAGRAMDAASMGDDEAMSVGVALGRLRVMLFVASGVLTAGAVVLAGPIGFVGLVCPHVVRLGAGPAHRPLVIGAAMAGAALVVGADSLVKAIDLASGRMPIGVLTAIIGGPVFLVLLRREMRGRAEGI